MIFEGLSDKLQGAFSKLKSKGKLTEKDVKAAMREVKLALLEADVNFKVVKDFVKKVKETKAKLLCMSTLMTTTMGGMETVINMLKEEGIRNEVTVMVGGSPISQKYANEIGADGYSSNAVEAVKVAKELLKNKNLIEIN